MSENGLVSVQSQSATPETIKRLLSALAKRNLTVFARVDHAAGAASIGLPLRPTELVIFGNPKGGTALMQDHQSAGIDLPLKALVWEDSEKKGVAYLQRFKLDCTAPRSRSRHGASREGDDGIADRNCPGSNKWLLDHPQNFGTKASMIQHYSDHAANELTFLAWFRTAIAVMGFGFLIERFDIFLATMASARPAVQGHRFANETGLAFVLLGVAMTMVAAVRFFRIAKQIDTAETVPSSGSVFDLALAALLVLLGLSLFLYLSRSVLPWL